jgi:hypothetical protein
MAIERLSFPTPWARQAFSEELARPWARLEVLRQEVEESQALEALLEPGSSR